ncbi:hypothetical protein [Neobacillus massiliamazoniensis]|uniref:DUF4405 domain-containing protein n=1 Tax=Neobacillus massiliamazoniensis TaxID=1499688 RepID=A0A0U1NYZ8_9BACI|nr:hypothetical protein [Neobacillus massiliamazoniensis]CRK83225.1 hypothetical protein BN000_03185 [Neobacillus massiliamazoniensis]
MQNRKEFYADDNKRFPIERNKRMTAIAGTVLFVLIIAELVITANLAALRSEHIFVGVLLAGPLVVKMCSTGYRFFRYYTKSPEFVRAGPPNILLRLLAPFLVVITILVFISGFGLVLGGHAHEELFIKIHAVSVTLWLPLLAVHIYAYIRKASGLIANDWTGKSKYRVPGREGRLGINVAAIIMSGIAAIIMTPWKAGEGDHGIPSPLIVGIMAAVIAVLIFKLLLRKTNNKPQL